MVAVEDLEVAGVEGSEEEEEAVVDVDSEVGSFCQHCTDVCNFFLSFSFLNNLPKFCFVYL